MAAKKSNVFEVECPCCQAKLKIDAGVQAVLSHESKVDPRTVESLSAGLDLLKKQEAERATAFDKRFEAVKSEKDVLARKFDELFKQAKESPDKGEPVKRPFDFD